MAGLKGYKQAVAEAQREQRRVRSAMKSAALNVAINIAADAKANVPVDQGELKNSIYAQATENGATIIVDKEYGIFQEFGTGLMVDVPAELADEAAKFRGLKSGSFEDFLKNIEAWCRRHGIDEKAAYPIAAAILKRGLRPQPFLYPAILKYKETIGEEFEKEYSKKK